jgi:hypothetical protein
VTRAAQPEPEPASGGSLPVGNFNGVRSQAASETRRPGGRPRAAAVAAAS